ncbi:MAG: GPH family glycoside/pentoside/hexuronide:cation symporter [Cryomorphaceae bacterium]|jgi:GPH family glycoside/pentoside/hexuronide:cation symporter
MNLPQKISLPTKLAYGCGYSAIGIQNLGFQYFLLIFYSQVMGVDAGLVGLALFIALTFDAVSDPVIGYLSDNTRSKWGRRHPWMYAAILPFSVSYFFLWYPPTGLSGNQLFFYILILSIIIRTSSTMFIIPQISLAAEMTGDYDERISILSFGEFFVWVGGIGMTVIAFAFFFVPSDSVADGLLNAPGYTKYGLLASAVLFLGMLVAALGTHHLIPTFERPPQTHFGIKKAFIEILESLANPSLVSALTAALMLGLVSGLSAGLYFYLGSFFWRFNNDQLAILAGLNIFGAAMALVIAPALSKRLGRKHGVMALAVLLFMVLPITILLRLLELMPQNGDPLLFLIVAIHGVITLAMISAIWILFYAMITDIVEDNAVKTGRRSEGICFAATSFVSKAVTGLGLLAASLVLALADFPKSASLNAVPEETIFRLGAIYAPAISLPMLLIVVCVAFYRIDRETHEENLLILAERAAD